VEEADDRESKRQNGRGCLIIKHCEGRRKLQWQKHGSRILWKLSTKQTSTAIPQSGMKHWRVWMNNNSYDSQLRSFSRLPFSKTRFTGWLDRVES